MTNNKKNSGLSPLALILIITASIVAAVGIVILVLKFIEKHREKKALDSCGCCDLDGWDLSDEDLLGDLSFDDGECCCGECEVPEEISAAVDEAIEAISAVSEDADAE